MSIVVTAFVIQLSIAIVAFVLREEVSTGNVVMTHVLRPMLFYLDRQSLCRVLKIFCYCRVVVNGLCKSCHLQQAKMSALNADVYCAQASVQFNAESFRHLHKIRPNND